MSVHLVSTIFSKNKGTPLILHMKITVLIKMRTLKTMSDVWWCQFWLLIKWCRIQCFSGLNSHDVSPSAKDIFMNWIYEQKLVFYQVLNLQPLWLNQCKSWWKPFRELIGRIWPFCLLRSESALIPVQRMFCAHLHSVRHGVPLRVVILAPTYCWFYNSPFSKKKDESDMLIFLTFYCLTTWRNSVWLKKSLQQCWHGTFSG